MPRHEAAAKNSTENAANQHQVEKKQAKNIAYFYLKLWFIHTGRKYTFLTTRVKNNIIEGLKKKKRGTNGQGDYGTNINYQGKVYDLESCT